LSRTRLYTHPDVEGTHHRGGYYCIPSVSLSLTLGKSEKIEYQISFNPLCELDKGGNMGLARRVGPHAHTNNAGWAKIMNT